MSRGNSIPREYMDLLKPFIKEGVIKVEMGGRHPMIVHINGTKRPVPGSPSDWRALLNFRSQLKKFIEGIEIDGQRGKHFRRI